MLVMGRNNKYHFKMIIIITGPTQQQQYTLHTLFSAYYIIQTFSPVWIFEIHLTIKKGDFNTIFICLLYFGLLIMIQPLNRNITS